MAVPRPPRSSQGTDMLEQLRFPDAIEFEKVLKDCNQLAKPIGSRSITNKCYILLARAACFSTSVFTGVRQVLDTLEALSEEIFPYLVILAADTMITDEMNYIIQICKSREVPYIFIPNKASLQDILCADREVLAVLVAFRQDPAMRREFEDCFISIKSHISRKKRKRERSSHATSPTVPPETGPGGEVTEKVSIGLSTVPSGEMIHPLIDEPGPSCSTDWVPVSTDSDFSDDSQLDRSTASKDISVNVPDEAGACSQDIIRIPSPTPAPAPSERRSEGATQCDTSTYAESSDDSLNPDPSSVFDAQLSSPRPKHKTHKFSHGSYLPYGPKEEGDDEKVRMYLRTLSNRKKIKLRGRTSVPPVPTPPQVPIEDEYRLLYPTPKEPRKQDPGTSGSEPQPMDLEVCDFAFGWPMADLSSTSSDTFNSTPRTTEDPQVLQAGGSNDDIMMDQSTPGMLMNEGASGDGNVLPMDISESSFAASSARTQGHQTNSSWINPSSRLELGDNSTITSTSTSLDVPMLSYHGLGDVAIPQSSRMPDLHLIPSFLDGSEFSLNDRCKVFFCTPRDESPDETGAQDVTDIPQEPSDVISSSSEASSLRSFQSGDETTSDSDEVCEVYSIPSSIGFGDSPSVQSFRAPGEFPPVRGLGDSSLHALGDVAGVPTVEGVAENPPIRGLGDAVPVLREPPSDPRLRRYELPPIPPFRGASSNAPEDEPSDQQAVQPRRSIYDVPPIPPYRGPKSSDQQSQEPDEGCSVSSSKDLLVSQAGPSNRMDDSRATPGCSADDGAASSRDVPAVPSNPGEVGDAAVIRARPRLIHAGGQDPAQVRATLPTDHGDAWPIGVRNRNVYRHRVSETGEGNQPAFMPTNFSFVFAPRIALTPGANENGRRRWNVPHGIPSEDDIVNIPFPGEEYSDDDFDVDGDIDEDNIESLPERPDRPDHPDSPSSESNESELSTEENVNPPSPFQNEEQNIDEDNIESLPERPDRPGHPDSPSSESNESELSTEENVNPPSPFQYEEQNEE